MKKPSLPNTDSGKVLNKIFDYLLPKATEIIYKNKKYQVLPNGTFNEIEFITLTASKFLTKPWNQYKPIKDAQFYEEQQFIDYQQEQEEQARQYQEQRKKQQEEERIQAEQESQIIQMKYDFANPIDKNWILNSVGQLSSEMRYATAAVIFSLLDESEWCIYKNSIYIKLSICEHIAEKIAPEWRSDIGKAFSYKYYRKKQPFTIRLVHYLPIDNTRPRGVYGAWVNDKLFYIGSTNRSFDDRFNEHWVQLTCNGKELDWYSKVNYEKDKIEFKPIINIAQLKCDKELDATDIKSMEYALILAYQPKGNIAGRVVPFKYNLKG